MTAKTIEGLGIEITYIKEILEENFKQNKLDHKEIITRQGITNGNIIKHDARLGKLESWKLICEVSKENLKSWVKWLPNIPITILTLLNIFLIFKVIIQG